MVLACDSRFWKDRRREGGRERERESDGGEREGEEELGRVGGGGGQLLIKREGIKTDCGAG